MPDPTVPAPSDLPAHEGRPSEGTVPADAMPVGAAPVEAPSGQAKGAQAQAEAHARTVEAVAHTARRTEGGLSFVALFGMLAVGLALVAAVLLLPQRPSVNRDLYLADSTRDALVRTQDSLDRRVDPEAVIGAPLTDTVATSPLARLAAPAAADSASAR